MAAGGSHKQSLGEQVWARLVADDKMSDAAGDLVINALDPDSDLAKVAADGTGKRRQPVGGAVRHEEVYLAGIHVRGFRGIGPEATLTLRPGPGLTLVMGRNGSGKSSFAEAAELVMTGANKRWEGRSRAWREGWRNLHDGSECAVGVSLLASGADGGMTVTKRWGPEEALDGGQVTQQRHGQPVRPFHPGEWRDALETYRPFLSYSELGSLMDARPSELYDALHGLLGLDDLTEAQSRIAVLRKRYADVQRDVDRERKDLAAEMRTVEDERAQAAAKLLRQRSPDLDAVAELALGSDTDNAVGARLRVLEQLTLPDQDEVKQAADDLRRAVDDLAGVVTPQVEVESRLAGLLHTAVAHHDEIGDCECPVCGVGSLDAEWARSARTQISALDDNVATVTAAKQRRDAAVAAARTMVTAVPAALHDAVAGVDVANARQAWESWAATVRADGPAELAAQLLAAYASVRDAVDALRQQARAELERLDETWAPLARRLATWHDEAHDARKNEPALAALKEAETWLKDTATDLRDDRIKPFAEKSQRIWRELRQQSNVELGQVRLAGSSTQRRVPLDVTVDEVPGAALAVMSQGELHALGLSLFLPRATVEASPFRFMVIDDPVQAMDPAKVDGLARVFADAARDRQVIVFTHDERLAESVRRQQIDATIWEVQRREDSAVALREASNPVERYLDDAAAIATTDQMPVELRKELVANCCRGALEAACHATVRKRLLANGTAHAEVEELLMNAYKTHQKVALAVFGAPGYEDKLLSRLNQVGLWAANTLQDCKKGAHRAITGDLGSLINDTKRLAAWLEQA